MTWLLDVIILLIIGLTIYCSAKKGFIKTLISAVSFVIAIFVTVAFNEPFAEIIKQTPVAQTIEAETEQKIADIILSESYDIPQLIAGKSEQFNDIVNIAGFDLTELNDWVDSNVTANLKVDESLIAKKIAEPIIDTVATLLAIIILFIGTQIVLKLIAKLLDFVANLPVLKTCNSLLGVILGVVLALVRVCLFCFAVEILIENSDFLGIDLIESLKPDNTVLYKFFADFDIFSFLR